MPIQRMITTEEAVAQLRAYARYIDAHAEVIVGDIEKPNYVTDGGINLSFSLAMWDRAPVLRVNKQYVVPDALNDAENWDECEAKAGATRVVTAWDECGRCVCSECGLRVDTSDAFCRHCGAMFFGTESTYVDSSWTGGSQE